jgi:hypothetical protein
MKTVLMTFLALLLITAQAIAKQGFYIGPEIVFNDIGGQVNSDNTIASGNGLGLKGGFGFNRYVGVETSFWMTGHDVAGGRTTDLRGLTIDMKVNFPIVNSHIEPYLLAGIGQYRLNSTRGNGGNFGAGMDVYLFPWLNFNVGLTRRIIDFGTAPKVSGEVTSMDIGFVYHFL